MDRSGASIRALLRDDVLIQTTAGLVLFFIAFYSVLAWQDQAWLLARRLLSFTLLSLVTLAFFKDLGEVGRRTEQRFWTLFGSALGSWWILAAFYLFYPSIRKPAWIDILGEGLLAAFYLLTFAAFENPPHRGDDHRPAEIGRSWSLPAISIFVLGLTAYYVAIPLLLDFEAYSTYLPSMFLYVVLDLALMIRALHLARLTRQPRWRAIYRALALAFLGMALTDLFIALNFAGRLGWQRGTWTDLFVVPQFVILILAVRARHLEFPRLERSLQEEYFDERLPALGRKTMSFAFAFTILHFGGYGAEIFNEDVRWIRELLVGVWLVILGVVALLQQRSLDKKAQALWIERATHERTLQKRANDLRLALQRRKSAAELDAAEDRFASLLEVLDDAGRSRRGEESEGRAIPAAR